MPSYYFTCIGRDLPTKAQSPPDALRLRRLSLSIFSPHFFFRSPVSSFVLFIFVFLSRFLNSPFPPSFIPLRHSSFPNDDQQGFVHPDERKERVIHAEDSLSLFVVVVSVELSSSVLHVVVATDNKPSWLSGQPRSLGTHTHTPTSVCLVAGAHSVPGMQIFRSYQIKLYSSRS